MNLLWSKQSATRTGRLVATAFVSALLLANTAAEAQQRTVRVITTQVAAEDFPYEIEALGTARANESIEVTSKVAEVITAIRFEEGGLVKAGDVLVEITEADQPKCTNCKACYQDISELFERTTIVVDGASKVVSRVIAGVFDQGELTPDLVQRASRVADECDAEIIRFNPPAQA